MYSLTRSVMLSSIKADLINVEVQIYKGIPNFIIIGLPSKAIVEAKERVSSALAASALPLAPKRVLVNLSPADIRKDGPQFDFAIAVAVLRSLKYIEIPAEFFMECCFIGELSLKGELKKVSASLALVVSAIENGMKNIFIAKDSLDELLILSENLNFMKDTKIFFIDNLKTFYEISRNFSLAQDLEFREILKTNSCQYFTSVNYPAQSLNPKSINSDNSENKISIDNVIGQSLAKRALEIALTGKHHLFMIGPPGCGKSMLAKAALSLMPELNFEQALELNILNSLVSQNTDIKQLVPFRTPHSSSTAAAIIGGGVPVSPGEVSLAHHGILFLDEFAEFERFTIEQLRTVLDNKEVVLNRARQKIVFPADFLLIAASNPCPCGYLGDLKKICTCSLSQIQRYQAKLSAPILDRIDLFVRMSRLDASEINVLSKSTRENSSSLVKEKISKARLFAQERDLDLELDHSSQLLLNEAVINLDLSSRVQTKIIRIARTIANLEARVKINDEHLAEALQYRQID